MSDETLDIAISAATEAGATVLPAGSVEYAVQCGDGEVRGRGLVRPDAQRFIAQEVEYLNQIGTYSHDGVMHTNCRPHRVISRYVTGWQEVESQ